MRSRATSARATFCEWPLAGVPETQADQNERDFAALKAAAASGRIEV
jgi:hypothetical protein